MSDAALISCRGVTVRFGGLVALDGLDLDVRRGEVLGIAGPNGAGKTTLFNAISGHVRPSAGTIDFAGRRISGLRPHRIFQLGVARTFQLAEVIGERDYFDNVLVGTHFARDRSARATWAFDGMAFEAATEMLARYGLDERAGRPAHSASLLDRKLLMLASAMAHAPEVLLLDEPIGGLSAAQADTMLEHFAAIRATGTTLVVIEHVMRALTAVSDRLVILHRGRPLFDGTPAAALEDEQVKQAYFGARAVGA